MSAGVLVEDQGWVIIQHEPDRDYFVEQGRLFGYPECCVQAFADDVMSGRMPYLHRGSAPGHVPCEACRER